MKDSKLWGVAAIVCGAGPVRTVSCRREDFCRQL